MNSTLFGSMTSIIQTTQRLGKKYSFPNVNVTETIIGPRPLNVEWRDTIGVAAPFNRGPVSARITSRKQFVALYGEDDSPGSIFIQQAMAQGATNFVISRVVAEESPSRGAIVLQSPVDPTRIPERVADGAERTVGITMNFEMISSPVRFRNSFYGMELLNPSIFSSTKARYLRIATNSSDNITEEFSGLGYFNFRNVGTVSYPRIISRGFITTDEVEVSIDTTGDGVHLVKFSPLDPNANHFKEHILPGLVLKAAATNSTITLGGSPAELTIMSFVFPTQDNMLACYAKGIVTSIDTPTLPEEAPTMVLDTPGGVTEGQYSILATSFRGVAGTTLPESPISIPDNPPLFDTFYSLPRSDFRSCYIILNSSNIGVYIPISYLNDPGTGPLEVKDIGAQIVFGNATQTTEIKPSKLLAFSVTVARQTISIGETDTNAEGFPETPLAFRPYTEGSEILSRIRSAILEDPILSNVISDVQLNTTTLPHSIVFTLSEVGKRGEELYYTVTRTIGAGTEETVTDLNFVDNGTSQYGSPIPMVGGVDALKYANRTFYTARGEEILYIQALAPGQDGNNVIVTVKPLGNGEFELLVDRTNQVGASLPPELFVLNNHEANPQSGLFEETGSSNYIRAYFIPILKSKGLDVNSPLLRSLPERVAPPDESLLDAEDIIIPTHPAHIGYNFLQDIPLEEGSEPINYLQNVPDRDYITAINRLKDADVSIITAPGVVAGDYRYQGAAAALVEQAVTSTPFNGLRIAVLAAPARLQPSRAQILNTRFRSPRVVLVGGRARVTSSYQSSSLFSAEGYYAGHLTVLAPHLSPAASDAGKSIQGIRALDSNSDLDELDLITRSNIELLYLDRVTNTIKFLNGRTTAGDLNNRWVSLRRYGDHLIMNLYRSLQWARSQPNTPELRSKVASACDAFLESERARGHITDYIPTIADDSINEPVSIAQGNLNILLQYIPVFPADYINLNVVRTFSSSFTLTVLPQ